MHLIAPDCTRLHLIALDGYSFATLQAALQYLMETSWAAVLTAAVREKWLRQEARRRSHREQVSASECF